MSASGLQERSDACLGGEVEALDHHYPPVHRHPLVDAISDWARGEIAQNAKREDVEWHIQSVLNYRTDGEKVHGMMDSGRVWRCGGKKEREGSS